MTLAVFSPMTPTDNEIICPLCRYNVEDAPNKKWYGHVVSGTSAVHYSHEKCLLELLQNGFSRCPGACNQLIDRSSLLTWTDRIKAQTGRIKPFFVNATAAAIIGAFLPLLAMIKDVEDMLEARFGTAALVAPLVMIGGLGMLHFIALQAMIEHGGVRHDTIRKAYVMALEIVLALLYFNGVDLAAMSDEFLNLMPIFVISGLLTAVGIEVFGLNQAQV